MTGYQIKKHKQRQKTKFKIKYQQFKNKLIRNWEQGQPDNWQDAPSGSEDCAEFYDGFPGTWNDQTCGYSRYYVCERDFSAGYLLFLYTKCNLPCFL